MSKNTVILRGQEYEVLSLEGDFGIGPILAVLEDARDIKKVKQTVDALKHFIPNLPDSLIDANGNLKLFASEYTDILDQIRLLWAINNLELARSTFNFKEEKRFAAFYARLQAEIEVKNNTLESDDDAVIGDPTPSQVFNYHRQYYDEQIAIAKDNNDSDRLIWLTKILADLEIKNVPKKPKGFGVGKQEKLAIESENEALRRQVEELQSKLS